MFCFHGEAYSCFLPLKFNSGTYHIRFAVTMLQVRFCVNFIKSIFTCQTRNLLSLSASSQHGALPTGYGQHHDQTSFPSAGSRQQLCLLSGIRWWLLPRLHHPYHSHPNSDLSCWNPPGPQLPHNPLYCPIRGTHDCQRAKETQGTRSLHVHRRQ